MNIPRKPAFYFIFASLLLHIVIYFVISFVMNLDSTIRKKIVVLGAHSRMPAQAIYKGKPRSTAARSTAGRSARSQANGQQKKAARKKSAPKKQAKGKAKNKATAPQQTLHPNKKALPELHKIAQKKQPQKLKKLNRQLLHKAEQKAEEQKERPERRILKPLEAPKQEEPEEESEEEELTPPEPTTAEQSTLTDDEEEDLVDLGHDYSGNLQMQRLQKLVSMEIERAWQPPVGVKKGTESCAAIRVDKNGNIKSFEFTSKSEIVIYDLSIVKAIEDLRFDPSLWGKTINVAFRQ